MVQRFNADGALDTASRADGSLDGLVSLDLGAGSGEGRAIALQADGHAVVVGDSTSVGAGSSNIMVACLNGNGSLDADFSQSDDGTPDDVASAVALQVNGKILVAGTTDSDSCQNPAIVRLNADGSMQRRHEETSLHIRGRIAGPTNLGQPNREHPVDPAQAQLDGRSGQFPGQAQAQAIAAGHETDGREVPVRGKR